MPNPSLEARPNIKTPGPRSGLAQWAGAFSTARAWRFAVGPASARTLGLMDPYSCQTVAEDLVYLATWGGSIAPPEIRRGSAVLREAAS